ncbi:MAG TPA: transglycosylase family protein [Solirubrobacteraceae bacterium]|nr:transglycosylase family protein [Solirubrobacteraceae bacterium]
MPASVRATLSLLLAAALCAGVALPFAGAQGDPDTLRDQAGAARAKEERLSADVGRLDAIAAKVQRQLDTLEHRRAEVQADLDRDEAELDAVRADLRSERARVARLRARLAEARAMLAERLVTRYKAADVDVVSVVLDSASFSDLLERAAFLRRIQQNDEEIVVTVREAREDAVLEERRLEEAEARQRRVVAALTARRNAVASMAQAVAARRESLARIRAARAAALAATRRNRLGLERRLREAEAALARAATAGASDGPWAIPWPIVQCESGGQNLPPNSAGASGYYQFLPETWKGLGGRGPHAYLRPKAEQDALAAKLWDGGRGAHNWVCAGLVG